MIDRKENYKFDLGVKGLIAHLMNRIAILETLAVGNKNSFLN